MSHGMTVADTAFPGARGTGIRAACCVPLHCQLIIYDKVTVSLLDVCVCCERSTVVYTCCCCFFNAVNQSLQTYILSDNNFHYHAGVFSTVTKISNAIFI